MRVAHIGNLANIAFTVARMLRRYGLDSHLFVHRAEPWNPGREEDGADLFEWIHFYGTHPSIHPRSTSSELARKGTELVERIRLIRVLREFDIIHSWAGALVSIWPALEAVRKMNVPYVAYATGSDLREGTQGRGRTARRMATYFRGAVFTGCSADPVSLQQVKALGLTNNVMLRLPVDTERLRPTGRKPFDGREGVVLLHASRFDWGIADARNTRSSMKNTQVFFQAFARFIREGGHGLVLAVERGIDLTCAKEYIRRLGIEHRVRWLPEVSKAGLVDYYRSCDAVVDQFLVGAFGMIALEAMACGKTLITFLDGHTSKLVYPEAPPIYNCKTEEDVYRAIGLATRPGECEMMGRRAREFVLRYHHPASILPDLVRRYGEALRLGRSRPCES